MNIKEVNNISKPFKYMIDSLDIQSSVSRNTFLMQEMMTSKDEIEQELNHVDFLLNKIKSDRNSITMLTLKFMKLRDIKGTITNLQHKRVLDDVELFEVKSFAILTTELNEECRITGIDFVHIPDLTEVIRILDPDDTGVPRFYIYDSYSDELRQIRKDMMRAKTARDIQTEEELRVKADEIEDSIRQELSAKLHDYAKTIKNAFYDTIRLDLLVAKALQAQDMNLCRPNICNDTTIYKGLFNPLIAESLTKTYQKFQPIDITLYDAPCVITGANMSGKTVILKTVAMAQFLMQFGCFVPAESAHIAIVDDVMVCMGDEQDELKGLSSFAAEILNLNRIVKAIKTQKNLLVLIDELARTTNPTEGNKIVNATITMLETYNVRSLITTHYGNITGNVRRLRVKGLKPDISNVTIHNINSYIDYSLVETTDTEVPKEAIRIAEILKIDDEFLKAIN